MSVQPVTPAVRTRPTVTRTVPAPSPAPRRPVAARTAASASRPRPRAAAPARSAATVVVEVALSGADALASATRLAAEIRDLVDSAGAEPGGVRISASVGVQLAPPTGFPSPAAVPAQDGTAATELRRVVGPAWAAPVEASVPALSGPIARPEFVAPQAADRVAKLPTATATATATAAPVTVPLAIYPARRVALLDGVQVALTRREFDLLLFLAEHAGRVFDRPQLLRLVWGHQVICGERTVDVHIRRLRAKVERTGPVISTVRGVGYRLDAPERVAVLHEA